MTSLTLRAGASLLLAAGIAHANIVTNTDLAVFKSVDQTNVTVGQDVQFHVMVTNLGPVLASSIGVQDLLGPGLTFAGATNTYPGGSYNATSNQWYLANLPVGASAVLHLAARVTAPGTLSNTASLFSSSPPDVILTNNSSSVSVFAGTLPADVGVGQTANQTNAPVGSLVQFSVMVTNLGPGNASNIVAHVTLGPGLSYSDSTNYAPGGYYDPYSGQWYLNSLTAGTWALLVVSAQVNALGVLSSSAAVVSSNPTDPNTTNNSATATIIGVPGPALADLAVTKTANVSNALVGDTVQFYVTVSNLGPGPATNIVVQESLGPGLSYSGSTDYDTNGYYDAISGQWHIYSQAAGASALLNVSALVTSTGLLNNTASILFSIPSDPNPTNNNASATIIANAITNEADLVVTKTASTNALLVGQVVTFQIGIANNGPNNATNVLLNDLLLPGLTYLSNSAAGNPYTYNPATGIWTLGAVFANSGTHYMYLFAVATTPGIFTNVATVSVPPGTTDPNTNNNTASAVVSVTVPRADLIVSNVASNNALLVGQIVTFQIGIANNGPSDAANVTITDLLPPGLLYLSNTAAGNPYTYNPATGIWSIGAVPAGLSTRYMYITALLTNGGTFTNVATVPVPPGITDPNTTNNTALAVVTAVPVYTILGFVRGCQTNGSPLANVSVNLSGATSLTTQTGTNGFFSFNNLLAGAYTVTPVLPGNVFAPTNAVLALSSNTTVPTFIGSIGLIQGTVRYGTNGPGVGGVRLLLTGAQTRSIATDTNGNYIFTNTPTGSYTVTPAVTNGFTFLPTNAAITLSTSNCSGQAHFIAQPRLVQLTALEAVQVIQDWSNSVRLIQNKETHVRAHLQLFPTNPNPVLVQGARLYGTGAGGALPGSPLSPVNSNGVLLVQTTNASDPAIRGQLTNSLNFRLPPAWLSGAVTLQFVCTNNLTVIPTNVVPANSTIQVTFVPSTTPQVKWFAYNWTNAGALQQVDGPAYADLPRRVLSLYPVAAVRSQTTPPIVWTVPPVPAKFAGTSLANPATWMLLNINARLIQQQVFDNLVGLVRGSSGNWIYHGVLAGPSPGTLGLAKFAANNTNILQNTFVSASFLTGIFYPANGVGRHTAPHEIGHNLDRPHDVFSTGTGACNESGPTNAVYPLFQPIPPPDGPLKPALGPMTNGVNRLIYGLDTLTLNSTNINPVVAPTNYFDFMSYCRGGPLDRWSSSFTYNALFTRITNAFVPPPPPPPPAAPRLLRFLRGMLDLGSDTGELLPALTMTTTNTPPSPPTGDYFVRLYDGAQQLLEEIPFAPDKFIIDEETGKQMAGLFAIAVPDDPAIQRVMLWHGANQLAVQMVSPSAPYISGLTLTAANGGTFTGYGPLLISWLGGDVDPGDQVTYTIQYSTDGGLTWHTLAVDWPTASYLVDSLYLQATTQGLLRITGSDGFNNSVPAMSGPFVIPNHPPVVTLNAPLAGAMLVGDQQVYLDASADDPQDGALTGPWVQWSSSRDGVLGQGAVLSFQTTALSEGTHVITVTALDSVSLSASASVQITVLHDPPPQLAIQLSGAQALLSWRAPETNYVLETSATLAPAAWSPVVGNPVTADDEQTVTVDLAPANRFFRLRFQ